MPLESPLHGILTLLLLNLTLPFSCNVKAVCRQPRLTRTNHRTDSECG